MKAVLLSLTLTLLGISYAEGNCADQDNRCRYWRGYCNSNDYVKRNCLKTCGRCPGTGTGTGTGGGSGKCGVTSVTSSRVIAGEDAPHGAWPWQVLMKYNGSPSCGGTLINTLWVLTAAHCVSGRERYPRSFSVTLGENDRRKSEGTEATYRVSRVISHRGYNGRSLDRDIALLKLERPVQLNKYVTPACLPGAGRHVPVGTDCYITGWGKIRHPGNMHYRLQQAKMRVVSNDVCTKYNWRTMRRQVTKNMLCAGSGGRSRISGCHGDSGGPFVCQTGANGAWEVHGAVSHGSPRCSSRDTYTVFARVAEFRDWIDQQMNTY